MTIRRNAAPTPRPKRSLLELIPASQAHQRRLERSERHIAALAGYSRAVVHANGDADVLAALTAAGVPICADWAVAVLSSVSDAEPVVSIEAVNPSVARQLADDLANPSSSISNVLAECRERLESGPFANFDAMEELCEDVLSPIVVAPLIIDGTAFGSLLLGVEGETPLLDQTDCRFVHDLARRASTTIAWIRRQRLTSEALSDHRQIEAALRESEGRFRTLANAGPVLIRQDDEQGNADYFNHPWLDFTGRGLQDQLGNRWLLESVHPDDVAVVMASMEKMRRRHEATTLEYRLRRFDGDYCWITDHGVPRYSVDGAFVGSIWSALDVSDQKRAESGLRLLAATGDVITSSLDLHKMLERFGRLVTGSFAHVCLIALDEDVPPTRLVAFSSRSEESKAMRAETEAVIQQLARPMMHFRDTERDVPAGEHIQYFDTSRVADPALRRELIDADITSLIIARMDARGRTSGAMAFCTRSESGRVFDAQDLVLARTLAHRVAVVVDNAQLYAKAQIAEDRYRRLFEGSADAIMAFDRELVVHDVNPALARLVQRQGGALVQYSLESLIVAQSDAWKDIFAALRGGEWRGEFTLIRGDGAKVPVEAWVTRATLSEGAVFIAAMRDISERASLETTRRQLLASVSHDLKNPINSIKANAQLALRQIRRGKSIDQIKIEETFARIDALTNRMVLQIEGLMDVALLEAGTELELELVEVDLGALASLIVDQYQATTHIHQLIVRSQVAPVIGFWDVHRLERVLSNLLTNAIKYSPDGGKIEIETATDVDETGRSWAILSIEDEGIGIPESDLPQLFSRFGRGANVVARISGTGIGLVGVSQIITQHGGTIAVESVEGQGSTFTIRLPLELRADDEDPQAS